MAKFSLKKEDKIITLKEDKKIEPSSVILEDSQENLEFNPWNYIRVVNVRGEPEFLAASDEKIVIANRDNPSLGNNNPLKSKTMAERDRVIEEHRKDLEADLEVKGPIYYALKEIAVEIVEKKQKIALSCYCAPLRCHNDLHVPIIVKMAKEILEQKKEVDNIKKLKI